jgi:chromate reductase, NAD(P)H dehydrogenase (quinone)
MSDMSRVLIFAGSARRESFNRRLARVAAQQVAGAGAQATLLELADHPLPLYDGDLEAASGLPANALKLKEIFIAHDAFIVVSPEYNSSIPALLKNTIDWASRPLPEQSGYVPFSGKPAALLSASPGNLGGLRGLRHLRDVLTELQMIVLPKQVSLPAANNAFDSQGQLTDPATNRRLGDLVGELLGMAKRLAK